MGRRGPKPKKIVDTTWSPNLAYAVGLLASDGCLATHQYLVDFTSVDLEQIRNYQTCLGVTALTIGKKTNGRGDIAFRVQLKNRLFYTWLQEIGLLPNKSKTLSALKIPRKYFFDFLRGLFDGDGSSYSYYDPRWRSSFMFYIQFASASSHFLSWLQSELNAFLGVRGHISTSSGCAQLRFAKEESSKIFEKMYYSSTVICLSRKRKKLEKAIKTNNLIM